MNGLLKIVLLLLLSERSFGQSLLDRLSACAENYRTHVNYFMEAGTRNEPPLQSNFQTLFREGAYIAHPLPQLPPQVTPQQFALALSKFSDNTKLQFEGLRYCRSIERRDIFEIYAMQTFIGDYLNPQPQLIQRMGVILSVVADSDGEFRIWGIEKMPSEFVHDPDSDEDGIPDRRDNCPWLAGGLETDGAHPHKACPKDADGDGIPDNNDKCPNQYGEPEDKGCPNYTENEQNALKKIQDEKKWGSDYFFLGIMGLKRLPNAIRNLTGLQELNVKYNQVNNLIVLKDLKQLTILNLFSNQISDLSALKDLQKLVSLDLGDNKINDISPLKDLKQLKNLDFYMNQITDLSTLNYLKQLTWLNLSYNQISNLNNIKELKQLTWLNLSCNQISDLSALSDLKHLNVLNLDGNQISNLSALKDLKQLTILNLFRNQIMDLSALKDLKQLKGVGLDGNQIRDLSALKDLKQLTWLTLSKNQISNLSALKGLKELTKVYSIKNQISDLTALKDLKQLTDLMLSENQISDLSALKDLKKLERLDLRNNKIQSFNLDLAIFPNLKELYLEGNPIQNIPKEVLNKGIDAIRAYQKQQKR